MKHNTVLIALSLLNALFFGLHLTGDIVFGIDQGGREILVGVLILAVYLYGAVGLPERLAGYIILLLGGLASALLPVIHTMGRPLSYSDRNRVPLGNTRLRSKLAEREEAVRVHWRH